MRHPPSGAVALTAVLRGRAIHDLGYWFVIWPVTLNSALIMGVALIFNNLAGRSYPHRPLVAGVGQAVSKPSSERIGFTTEDLDAVLGEYDQLMEVDRGDLKAILRQEEIRSYRRRLGLTTCADIMSKRIVAIAPNAPRGPRTASRPRRQDDSGHGRVRARARNRQADGSARQGRMEPSRPRLALRRRLRLTKTHGRAPNASIEDIMTTPVPTVTPGTPIVDVAPLMAQAALQDLPVVDRDGRLEGIVSQSDVVIALLAEGSDMRRRVALEPARTDGAR